VVLLKFLRLTTQNQLLPIALQGYGSISRANIYKLEDFTFFRLKAFLVG
jgi:hypothetical protein